MCQKICDGYLRFCGMDDGSSHGMDEEQYAFFPCVRTSRINDRPLTPGSLGPASPYCQKVDRGFAFDYFSMFFLDDFIDLLAYPSEPSLIQICS